MQTRRRVETDVVTRWDQRKSVTHELRRLRAEISRRLGIEPIGLFGAAARGAWRGDSDIGVLVSFRGPASADGYVGLRDHLE